MNGRQPVTTTNAHPIDPDTGLPELPSGYLWSIHRSKTGRSLIVGLLKVLSGSQIEVLAQEYSPISRDYVRIAANNLLLQLPTEDEDRLADELCGVYPPKKFTA